MVNDGSHLYKEENLTRFRNLLYSVSNCINLPDSIHSIFRRSDFRIDWICTYLRSNVSKGLKNGLTRRIHNFFYPTIHPTITTNNSESYPGHSHSGNDSFSYRDYCDYSPHLHA